MCLLFHWGTYCDLKSMVIYTVLRFIYVSICSMDFTLRIFSKGVSMLKKRNFLKTFLLSAHTLLVLRPLQDLVAVIVSVIVSMDRTSRLSFENFGFRMHISTTYELNYEHACSGGSPTH